MIKSLYTAFIIFLSFSALVISLFSSSKLRKDESHVSSGIHVLIQRMDHSIKSDDGTVLALIYYDKPVVIGKPDVAAKINAFFEEEYQGWINGNGRIRHTGGSLMDIYINNVEKMQNIYGEESLKKQPLLCTVDTEVVLSDQNFLSVKQYYYGFIGGPGGGFHHGSTFDMQTGELIPFDHIIETNADEFREDISSYIYNTILNVERLDLLVAEYIKRFYEPNEESGYASYFNGRLYRINYEYYYDGEYIYLTLNNWIGNNDAVLRWNGVTGDGFQAQFY